MTTTVSKQIPPLSELIHGEDSEEALFGKISEIGKNISSATGCCEYFCTPPGNEKMIRRALEGTNVKWGQYTRSPENALKKLEKEGRVVRPKNYRTLVTAIQKATQEQIVVIECERLPKENFLKRGTSLIIRQKRNYEEQIPLDKAIADAMKKVNITQTLSGFDFQGVKYTDRSYKMIALIDVIRGCIYDAALHTAMITRTYMGDRPLTTGAKVVITQIPSFHNHTAPYLVGFEGIPVFYKAKKEAAGQGFDIKHITNSPREQWDSVKFIRNIQGSDENRMGVERRWDHHSILAYQRVARQIEKEYKLKVIKPYIEPSANTTRFYWKLLNNCLVIKEGRLKPLNLGQAEFLLWKLVGMRNKQRTYRHKAG